MSAAVHLARLVPSRPPRDGYLIRLRVRARRATLDRRLAAGADPIADDDLTRRAAALRGRGPARGRPAGRAPRGVAQAAMLIHEGDSPLFSMTTTDTALNRRLAEIVAALESL
jgi:hypothetical protein